MIPRKLRIIGISEKLEDNTGTKFKKLLEKENKSHIKANPSE